MLYLILPLLIIVLLVALGVWYRFFDGRENLNESYQDKIRKCRFKRWRSKHRTAPLRAWRCWRGKHNPSPSTIFTCMGAVIVGGPCTRCHDPVAREICWLGNEWDFPGAAIEKKMLGCGTTFHVSPLAVVPQLESRGYTYIGDFVP